jgi:hypothetical protein
VRTDTLGKKPLRRSRAWRNSMGVNREKAICFMEVATTSTVLCSVSESAPRYPLTARHCGSYSGNNCSSFCMKNHQHINGDSGSGEYYTPQPIIEAARRVMGEIDLDPASSSEANKRVKTLWFFDQHNDGLRQNWRGRVWMNHPFGRKTNRPWIAKLVHEYEQGGIGSGLHHVCQHVGKMVCAVAHLSAMLPFPAHKLLPCRWHAEKRRHQGERHNLFRREPCRIRSGVFAHGDNQSAVRRLIYSRSVHSLGV